MATSVLCIVESAYRATVEEHDDTVLWLTHMLRTSGLDVSVLLRANAVSYAVATSEAPDLRIGELAVRPPRLDHDLGALAEAGASIYVVGDDVQDRGIARGRLIPAVETVARGDVPELLGHFDRVLHW
jgi:hypothetical protein